MDTKPLLYGLVGFFIGGLLVAVAATTFDKPAGNNGQSTAPIAGNTATHQPADSLRTKSGDEFDAAFIEEMIMHHEGAVKMADLVATRAKHDELKTLANNIVSSQSREIVDMRAWQKQWGYKTVSPSQHGDSMMMHQ